MSWGRRTAAAVLIALVGFALSGCFGSGGGVSSARPDVTAGAGTHDLVMYGTIRRHGKPVAGAQLAIVLSPEREMADAEEGDRFVTFTAARATSAEDGTFALRLDPEAVKTKYFGSGRDLLNFDLNVVAGKEFAPWSSTVWSVGKPAVWRSDGEAAPADSAMKVVVDFGTKRLTVTDSFDKKESSDLFVIGKPPGLKS